MTMVGATRSRAHLNGCVAIFLDSPGSPGLPTCMYYIVPKCVVFANRRVAPVYL